MNVYVNTLIIIHVVSVCVQYRYIHIFFIHVCSMLIMHLCNITQQFSSTLKSGVPNPVAASYPAVQFQPYFCGTPCKLMAFVPIKISVKPAAEHFFSPSPSLPPTSPAFNPYSIGFKNPNAGFPACSLASFQRDTNPANAGAEAEVPAMVDVFPFNTI